MKKRDLFAELSAGMDALAQQRLGKRTLKTHRVSVLAPLTVDAAELQALRERFNVSRAVWAQYLRTNLRTLENWEQGRAKPNAQAALLIRLIQKHPDTLDRLRQL